MATTRSSRHRRAHRIHSSLSPPLWGPSAPWDSTESNQALDPTADAVWCLQISPRFIHTPIIEVISGLIKHPGNLRNTPQDITQQPNLTWPYKGKLPPHFYIEAKITNQWLWHYYSKYSRNTTKTWHIMNSLRRKKENDVAHPFLCTKNEEQPNAGFSLS